MQSIVGEWRKLRVHEVDSDTFNTGSRVTGLARQLMEGHHDEQLSYEQGMRRADGAKRPATLSVYLIVITFECHQAQVYVE
jgi:hypothetical protein